MNNNSVKCIVQTIFQLKGKFGVIEEPSELPDSSSLDTVLIPSHLCGRIQGGSVFLAESGPNTGDCHSVLLWPCRPHIPSLQYHIPPYIYTTFPELLLCARHSAEWFMFLVSVLSASHHQPSTPVIMYPCLSAQTGHVAGWEEESSGHPGLVR